MEHQLSRYDQICNLLAEAKTVDDLRDVMYKADGVKEYARRAKNRHLELEAIEWRGRAERQYGEILLYLKETGQLKEGRPKKLSPGGEQNRVYLPDLGTSRKFSSKCQQLAALPADKFERLIVQWRKRMEGHDDIAFDLFGQHKGERRGQREAELGQRILALPQRRYGVIIADPEWAFKAWSPETGMDRAAENHYPTSPTEIIASRNVASLAADDCALGLWATVPMLPDALKVMEAWGFSYKTHWVWAKDRIGTGYWNRNKHELFLWGTKGEIPGPAPGQQWESVLARPRGEHSEKPEAFLEMIESYFPSLPKIELNRRGPARPGWDAWGWEVVQKATA